MSITDDDLTGAGLTDWRVLNGKLRTRYATGSFTAGLDLITAITERAEAANHHPDVTLTYPSVDISLISHDRQAITDRDLALAEQITALAAERGISAEPASSTAAHLGIDTPDASRIAPFWMAAYGLDPRESGQQPEEASAVEIVDPLGELPDIFFQAAEPRETRNRIHLDIYVPADTAEQRVAAVREAGRTLVSSEFAPAWWILADADGNEMCVCTWHSPPKR